MKNLLFLITVQLLIIKVEAQLQLASIENKASTIGITTAKTTNLVFPREVRHVDRGTADVLVQGIKAAPNMLLIKAAKAHFKETNLSVITEGGGLFNILIRYDSLPKQLVYYYTADASQSVTYINTFPEKGLDNNIMKTYANSILNHKRIIYGVKQERGGLFASLKGIYIKDQVLFFQLYLDNQSPLDYPIDFIRTFIKAKKTAKRTATQEQEFSPLLTAGNATEVKANSHTAIVLAFPQFTLPEGKYFEIELLEKRGGRNLLLKIKNGKLLKALPLETME